MEDEEFVQAIYGLWSSNFVAQSYGANKENRDGQILWEYFSEKNQETQLSYEVVIRRSVWSADGRLVWVLSELRAMGEC